MWWEKGDRLGGYSAPKKKEDISEDLTMDDVVAYQRVVENELTQRCNEVLELLKNKLIDKNKREYYISTWNAAALQHPYKDNADQTSKDQTNTARVKMCFDRWKEDVLGNQTYTGSDEFRNWGKQEGVTQDDVAEADKWFSDSLSPNKKAAFNKPPALAARTTIVETLVFYLKMCGDYYRYLAEINPDSAGKKDDATNSSKFYKDALLCASTCLEPTHPTRLGLSLNMSVCHYEILDQKKEACALAKEAFDLAIAKLDSLNDSNYKDSTLIMQLLRDNLTIWTAEDNADGTGDDKNMA